MSRLRAAGLLALLAAFDAGAEADLSAPPTITRFRFACADENCSVLVVPLETMEGIQRNNNANALENLQMRRELQQAKDQLEKMRALKGCAKSEVTEPSKNPAPKPLPHLPREADS